MHKDSIFTLLFRLIFPYAEGVMYDDESMSNHRFTVKEAAKRLNTSEAAIRQRMQRESITYEKDEETGRVYIILDGSEERLDGVDTDIEIVLTGS